MSKELPYFKFQPSEWVTGDITLCSMEAQGLFINLCSYYWLKDCSISLANAQQRFSKNISLFDELLSKDIFTIDSDANIVIRFLDEQMEKFIDISAKRRESGKLTHQQKLSKSSAKAPYKEIDKEKIKREKKIKIYSEQAHSLFSDLVILFDERLRPKDQAQKDKWLNVCERLLKEHDHDHIKTIVKKARMDSFWSKTFLSLTKLMDNDKNGVKYFLKFELQFNGESKKINDYDFEGIDCK